MPELPEVETVRKYLLSNCLNKKIVKVDIYWDNSIVNNSDYFKRKLVNETILDIKRRGKWLIFYLDNYLLLSHLRMEGKYYYSNELNRSKYDIARFTFSDGSYLVYRDVRKFGKLKLVDKDIDLKEKLNIGLEPSNLTVPYLKEAFKNKNSSIKTNLLDQTIIAGLGNIYANEVLFASRINPHKLASSLSDKELNNIIKSSQKIIAEAIKLNGTTIRSFAVDGISGSYQDKLKVHGKTKCSKCNSELVKEKINGRTAYYCKNCQKL